MSLEAWTVGLADAAIRVVAGRSVGRWWKGRGWRASSSGARRRLERLAAETETLTCRSGRRLRGQKDGKRADLLLLPAAGGRRGGGGSAVARPERRQEGRSPLARGCGRLPGG